MATSTLNAPPVLEARAQHCITQVNSHGLVTEAGRFPRPISRTASAQQCHRAASQGCFRSP